MFLSSLAAIYSEVLSALAVAKPEVNLDYFSNNFGVAMPSNFPKFEVGKPFDLKII